MTLSEAVLVKLITRYFQGLLDSDISNMEAHKLMYFMQVAGQPLRLNYVKGPYGPYAENLRHVFRAIEGYMVSGYADGGDAPDKPLELVPGAEADAERFLNAHTDTRARLERVGALVDGFESAYSLELLATVHWVVKEAGGHIDDAEVVPRIHAWSERTKQFTPRQIGIALGALRAHGWIEGAAA